MRLASAPKIEGGRCAGIDDTIARLEAALSKICSFEYTEEKVCESLYWGALHTDILGFPPMGKGSSSTQCKVSTLAEAAEWLALRRQRELPGYMKAHQNDVPNPLPLEKLMKHISLPTPDYIDKVKDADLAQHWVDGFSFMTETELKVPLEYVNGISGTNGVAAGNCIEEAIIQGACEIIERRAVITALRNQMVLPTIDCKSIEDPVSQEQIAFLQNQGLEILVKDLSFGGALPCIGIYVINPEVPSEFQAHHLFKAAAAYNRVTALRSCLTEYAQVCHLGRRDSEEESKAYEHIVCEENGAENFLPLFWFGYVPYKNADFLKQGDLVPFDPGEELSDCLEDIERVKQLCGQLEMDFIVVDLTDPTAGFPVVQIVIPGYSDIIPYHPPSSPVLLSGWTRDLPMGHARVGDTLETCTAEGLFPNW